MTRILIADDEPVARQVLRELLEEIPGVEICGEAATGAEALVRCADWVLPRGRRPVPATARIHLPADCDVRRAGATVEVTTPGGRRFKIHAPDDLRWDRSPVPGWRAMFTPAPRHCLALPVPTDGLELTFEAITD